MATRPQATGKAHGAGGDRTTSVGPWLRAGRGSGEDGTHVVDEAGRSDAGCDEQA